MAPESPTSPRRESQKTRPSSTDFSIESEPRSSNSSDQTNSEPSSGNVNLTLDIPKRPTTLHSVNSSTGLLSGDGETPTTPYLDDPFAGGHSGPVTPISPSVSGTIMSGAPVQDANTELGSNDPPKIKINSIPNTPDPNDTPRFEARPSFSAPFASSHDASPTTILTHRKSSIAPTGLSTNYGSFTRPNEDAPEYDIKRASGAKKDFANRRSLRAKAVKGGKKERESKDYKTGGGVKRKPFESTRLKGEIYKPWLEKKDPAQRWARWITIVSIIIGFALAAFLCYDGYRSVPNLGSTCLLLNDNFDTLDTKIWQREVRLDGYGTGSFQWTTASDNNSFVDDGILYIVPTLSSDVLGEEAISNGYTLNLTLDGTCTSTNVSQCAAVSNSSRLTVINPVQSARLITKNSVNIKYGKVEVRAKFPTGDWLWPSITMLPVEEKYGAWPRSGQIDILTGRGNNQTYPNRGIDYAQSDLHWGPTTDLDRLYLTWGYREQRRTYFNQQWHTFGLEWNDKYMWTYIDSKVSQVISLRFNKQSFWERGRFPPTITNTTSGDVVKLISPWINSENNVAPFDQSFYLVLDLAVGSTDGWFPDGEGGKPWLDNSGTSMSDFWLAKDKWWNQWPKNPKERGFAIDSVKIWKTGSC